MADTTSNGTPVVDTTSTTLQPTANTAGLISPDNVSRAESFVSAPSTPLEATAESTPATTLSAGLDQEKEADKYTIPTDGSPLKTIIARPLPQSIPHKPAALTNEQQTKYDTVLAQVLEWKEIPSSTLKNASMVPLEDHERMWLTRECLLRYLRATKWNTVQAVKRLQSSLSWRREYGADGFTSEYISPENETGKQILVGYDIEGRPCWYMTPSRQNTKLSDRQIHQVSYMLDRAVELMPPGQETICLLISFKDSARSSVPSIGLGRQALNVLQNHNPERLGRALIMDTPWFVSTFLKLISPFIDPLTKEKLVFDPELEKHIPVAHLLDWYKGDLKFEYDHSAYWPSLKEESERRRVAYRERWEAGGKNIGENEAYLRGGDCRPVQEERAASAAAAATASNLPEQVSKLGLDT